MMRALAIGAKQEAGNVPLWDRPMDFLLERTLRPKIGARFGGRMKAMVSGGAPLNPEVGLFFQSLGLTFLQGYGQTEAGPVISCNRPSAVERMGSGRAPEEVGGVALSAGGRDKERRGVELDVD